MYTYEQGWVICTRVNLYIAIVLKNDSATTINQLRGRLIVID